MKIVYDLHGVIADLSGYLEQKHRFKIQEWHWDFNGEDVYDMINPDLSQLLKIPITEYYGIIMQHIHESEIWTSIPQLWYVNTIRWIRENCGEVPIRFFDNPQEKYACLEDNPNYILIEDYPFFQDYSRIYLIDRPYNQETKALVRIKNPLELQDIIERVGY